MYFILFFPHSFLVEGEGHSKKHIFCHHQYKVYIELSYSPKFQLLKCMLSQEIVSKEAQNSASAAAILKQVLIGQATKCDVILTNLILVGSSKCSWLSSTCTLSGFPCLVPCVKMPLCSVPGCSKM